MKKYTFALFIFCAIAFTGCLNNDFMERYPLGNPTEETAFVTYDNFKAYAWGLYETLPKLGYGDTSTDDISYNQTRGCTGPINQLCIVITQHTVYPRYSTISRQQ